MDEIRILWADDEIDLLKPQIRFLEQKGYKVQTVTNGYDAIDEIEHDQGIQIVFLDESMPGIGGLETLAKLKEIRPHLLVVMITKNETENLMNDAIGSQIADYLIKPVNPNQILLTLKKLIDNKRLVKEKRTMEYQQDFRQIFMQLNSSLDIKEWVEVYKKIILWELKLDESRNIEMSNILSQQKDDANDAFAKYVIKNYENWVHNLKEYSLTMSNTLMREKVFPYLDGKQPTVVLLLDNFRLDQWKVLEPIFLEYFKLEEEDYFFSILPTTTQYSRNAIFSGLMPSEIAKKYPEQWLNDNEEGGKNMHEEQFLRDQVKRVLRKEVKVDYQKITNVSVAKQLLDNALNLLNNDLSVIVYNFIDMLSHARTEMEVLKELANDETAYRSLTKSWFMHSPLFQVLQKLSTQSVQLIVLTDHGTIRVKNPVKVLGDRETTTNLRYKVGKNLQYDSKAVLEFRNPEDIFLPKPNMSSGYIFGLNDDFFLYPNNYNYYNNYYKNTFQHGGVSLEEMICPVIRMKSK
ncbi:MAG: PglZ domain-containing protein [Saprospiraceae bacterium]|jgi:CheY-like chemotaxis protein|nr:PglZ domain-containing protein [Saprospiraceae bacterium]